MTNFNQEDYKKFDQPMITNFIFHPRKSSEDIEDTEKITGITIPVENDIQIGARFFHSSDSSPTILFFHGNGEIVDDYSDLGPIYANLGINFLPVDYRGYGRSSGSPTVSAMMGDSHKIFDYVKNWLKENNKSGKFIIMGRSLGSAPALELAYNYFDEIDALIIESGFAHVIPLLRLLGINTDSLGIKEDEGFGNLEKIKAFSKPALIIHAQHDHIIPFNDGKTLFEALPEKTKQFLKIPNANHNTIFAYGIDEYMYSIKNLIDNLSI